jgi:hypothetical protein
LRLAHFIKFVMPAITRSKTRQLIDKMNGTDPYYSRYLKTIKQSGSASKVEKFESLLQREQTPDIEELFRSVIDLHQESEMKRSQDNGLHILGDIMYKALSQVRSYLSKCPDPNDSTKVMKFNTTTFMNSWRNNAKPGGNLSDDTTPEAKILRKFVVDKSPGKAKDPKYVQERYDRYKAWLTIYDDRCRLVHGGLDQMEAQDMWNALKKIRHQIESGEAALTDKKLTQFALDAVDEVETHKFQKDGEVIKLRNGPEIIP